MIFLLCNPTTLLLFCQKLCCIGVFVPVLYSIYRKNRKKSANFLQFFLLVYQQVRRKLKKKFVKSLDKILKCCIFAALFDLKQDK